MSVSGVAKKRLKLGDLEKSGPSSELARIQLGRILASRTFAHSENSKLLLRYMVDRLIQGQPEQAKEFRIGVEVFGRGSSYDPRTDPVVRLSALRLRLRLKHYYQTEGRKERVVIEIPKRAYVAILRERNSPSRKVQPIRPELRTNGVRKTVAVLPFDNLTGHKRTEQWIDRLTDDLIDALANVRGLRVVARTSAFRFKGKAGDVCKIGRRLRADVVLEGSVRVEAAMVRIRVRLVGVADGCYLWSETYDRNSEDLAAVEDEISAAILRAFAEQRWAAA